VAVAAPLRVGYDAKSLDSPAHGVRRYAERLFDTIPRVAPEVTLVAVGRQRSPLDFTNLGRMLVGLPLAVRQEAPVLFHAPAYVGPLWGVHPLVLTIHDVSYERHPEWYPYRRDGLRRRFYRRCAQVADLVITDSEFSRREIVAAYGLDPNRIAVIPLGVGEPFGPANGGTANSAPVSVSNPCVVHVGDLHQRRDLAVALDAVLIIRARRPSLATLQLVLAGIDRGVGQMLRALASQQGQPDALVLLGGGLDDRQLAALYRAARAFVYPSRYEGFGLPLVEAMACGTPVVAARAAATPEVVGAAGLLVDPGDARAFADALEAVLVDSARAAELRAAGLRRAAGFIWERTATETVAAYRRCISEAVRESR
jgi:glycosyltransferase involved in cell wall biosynthesis